MRWFDEYLGLMSAVALVGVAVLWAEASPAAGIGALSAVAAAVLALMGWHVLRTPRVLVVGEPAGRPEYRLREAIDEAGYGLRFCAGPERRRCPVLDGRPCPVRGHPVLAMVVRGAGERGPLPPCGRALGIPAVGVPGGSEDGLRDVLLPASRS